MGDTILEFNWLNSMIHFYASFISMLDSLKRLIYLYA